jgi:cyclopropane-fatty-acyl-phospholipid synthase
MNDPPPSPNRPDLAALSGGASSLPRSARRVLRLLARLQHGRLDLQLPDGSSAQFGAPEAAAARRCASRTGRWPSAVMQRGDIGLGESFIQGPLEQPGPGRHCCACFLVNRRALEDAVYGHWWGALLARLKHLLNRNTARAVAATSSPITTSATPSTSCGWTRA